MDFSDYAQGPNDLNKSNIKGIFDHHKLGDITTDSPLEAWIQPIGSANTVIKIAHDYYGVGIDKKLAGIMLCAIISDTDLFKSPTTTPTDIKVAKELAAIAEVKDVNALGYELFKAKSDLNASAYELVKRDYKEFDMSGKKVGIGQIQVLDLEMITPKLRSEIIDELHKIKQDGYHTLIAVLSDLQRGGSELIVVSDDEENVYKALNAGKGKFVDGLVSRKKQIVPPLQALFK